MTHALITIAALLKREQIEPVRMKLEKLGNPANSMVQSAFDARDTALGLHFMSMHALPASDGKTGHLVMEYSADSQGAGDDDSLGWIVSRIEAQLTDIFSDAADWKTGGDLLTYLRAHKIKIGFGWFDVPGLAFAGTPGMSVGRIRDEAMLAGRVVTLLEDQPGSLRPLGRISAVRDALRVDSENDWSWALKPPPEPLPPRDEIAITGLIAPLACSFIKTYFVGFLFLIAFLAAAVSFSASDFMTGLGAGLKFLGMALVAALIVLIGFLLLVYRALRNAEESDWVGTRAPERRVLAQIRARENQTSHAHNHMVSLTVLKPDLVRKFTVRLAFWIIAQLATRSFKLGHLGEIGTIHFARWVTMPGTRDFVFFSNYGGSWESYLEDFITKAHNGLTAVCRTRLDFPNRPIYFKTARRMANGSSAMHGKACCPRRFGTAPIRNSPRPTSERIAEFGVDSVQRLPMRKRSTGSHSSARRFALQKSWRPVKFKALLLAVSASCRSVIVS